MTDRISVKLFGALLKFTEQSRSDGLGIVGNRARKQQFDQRGLFQG